MIWQDVALTCCSIAFSYGLIPQVIKIIKSKKCDQFSWHLIIPTILGLIVHVVVCITLTWYLTASIASITVLCWLIIMYMKIKYRNK